MKILRHLAAAFVLVFGYLGAVFVWFTHGPAYALAYCIAVSVAFVLVLP